MIELLLEAERAMAVGLLDQAERYYAQVAAADPKNSIAIVGLARVALERDDQRGAYTFARRALVLDPDNPQANHLARRMAEIMSGRGEILPEEPAPSVPAATAGANDAAPAAPSDARPTRPGLVDRLLRRRR
jgi:tetratricopeptide (TPR) repeat protein